MNKTRNKRITFLWKSWIFSIFAALLIATTFKSAIADWNIVPTGSMNPTIVEGDRIFVNKLAYDLKIPYTTWHIAKWSNPERGDIVVFYSPEDGKRWRRDGRRAKRGASCRGTRTSRPQWVLPGGHPVGGMSPSPVPSCSDAVKGNWAPGTCARRGATAFRAPKRAGTGTRPYPSVRQGPRPMENQPSARRA